VTRSPLFNLRLDEETKARWQARATDAGYTLSEFIRVCVEAQISALDEDGPIFPIPVVAAEAVAPGTVELRDHGRLRATLEKVEVRPDPKPAAREKKPRRR
jgi:predicted DNA-binding protein